MKKLALLAMILLLAFAPVSAAYAEETRKDGGRQRRSVGAGIFQRRVARYHDLGSGGGHAAFFR